jgi:membrane protein YdbS with pleckstrin-like domain
MGHDGADRNLRPRSGQRRLWHNRVDVGGMRAPPQQHLSEKAIAAWRVDGVRAALWQGAVLITLTSFVVQNAWLTIVIGCCELVVLMILAVVVAPRFYARTWRYEISEHHVYIQSGFLTITRHMVPFLRIQNVDTVQGPVDKHFGLSTVTVSTAGGKATIPHLDEHVADELRELISVRSRATRRERDAG